VTHKANPKPLVRLEDWFVFHGILLVGAVYGHPNPRHCDGKRIRTSRIIRQLDDGTIETQNTRYTLGLPLHESQVERLAEVTEAAHGA
jgi:hypothetical protein